MTRFLPLLPLGLALLCLPAAGKKADAPAARWDGVETVYFTVEGVHDGAAPLTAKAGGVANVIDRVSMTFEWSVAERKMTKLTSLKNYPSETASLRDSEPKCLAPFVRGPFELATVMDVVNGPAGALKLMVERNYPLVEVAQFCTISRKPIAAEILIDERPMVVPTPALLARAGKANKTMAYAPDRKSMIVLDGRWKWTFTPQLTAPQ